MAYCKNVLSESVWLTLDESTQSYLREWDEVVSLINENSYLFETDLTLQQIQQIFQNAEKYAIGSDQFKTKTGAAIGAAGSAANAAGKAVAGTLRVGKDITAATVRQISDKVNELGKAIQDTTPVRNADAAFKQAQKDLYDKLGGKDAKVNQIIHKMAELSKEHPGKTKVLIAALTTAAAVAAGPAGGAGAGFVLRSANELLKGESLSTAVGRSAKTAAIGALAGMAFNTIGDAVETAITNMGVAEIKAFIDEMSDINLQSALNLIPKDLRDIFPEIEQGGKVIDWEYDMEGMTGSIDGVYLSPEQVKELSEISGMDWSADEVRSTATGIFGGDNAEALKAEWVAEQQQRIAKILDYLETAEADPMQAQYKEAFDAFQDWDPEEAAKLNSEQNREALSKMYSLQDKIDFINQATQAGSGVAQGAATAASMDDKKKQKNEESIDYDVVRMKHLAGMALTESEQKVLAEGPLDAIKRGAQKAANVVGAKAKSAADSAAKAAKVAGKELGQKITYKQLSSMWQSAGKPLDNAAIFKILMDAGLDNNAIMAIADASKIKIPTPQEIAAYKKTAAGQGTGNAKQGMMSRIGRAVTGQGNALDKAASAHSKGLAAMQGQQQQEPQAPQQGDLFK
jgi:hypothetical protein